MTVTNKMVFYSTAVLFAIFLSIRLWNLAAIPAAISHDEIYYLSEARAIAVSGSDTSGTWSPFSLTAANPLYAELPGTLLAPAAAVFSQNPVLAGRITHVILGTLLALLLGLIARLLLQTQDLTVKNIVFLSTFCIASFNPWLFQFSRMSFDAVLSLFFYFLALYLLLAFQGWKKTLAILPLLIGFFCYQGLKVIFIPFVFGAVFFSWQQRKKDLLPLLAVMGFSVMLFVIYIVRLQSQEAGGRINDLIFFDSSYTQAQVLKQRQQAIDSPLLRYFVNDYSVILERFIATYLESFNPTQLFYTGESIRNPFSVWTHGIFYVLDAVLIILGLYFLCTRKKLRTACLFLIFCAVIAPLPSAINATGTWILFRSSLLFMVGILLSGIGLGFLIATQRKFIWLPVIALYLLLVSRFLLQYFVAYPVIGTQGQYFAQRVLASYVARVPDKQVVVFAPEEKFVFETILVFNNWITEERIPEINQAFQTKKYQIQNVTVRSGCIEPIAGENTIVIAHATVQPCEGTAESLPIYTQIPSLLDSGGIYKIYNDVLCGGHDLGRFSSVRKMVFAVEHLETSELCKHFVIYN